MAKYQKIRKFSRYLFRSRMFLPLGVGVRYKIQQSSQKLESVVLETNVYWVLWNTFPLIQAEDLNRKQRIYYCTLIVQFLPQDCIRRSWWGCHCRKSCSNNQTTKGEIFSKKIGNSFGWFGSASETRQQLLCTYSPKSTLTSKSETFVIRHLNLIFVPFG